MSPSVTENELVAILAGGTGCKKCQKKVTDTGQSEKLNKVIVVRKISIVVK